MNIEKIALVVLLVVVLIQWAMMMWCWCRTTRLQADKEELWDLLDMCSNNLTDYKVTIKDTILIPSWDRVGMRVDYCKGFAETADGLVEVISKYRRIRDECN